MFVIGFAIRQIRLAFAIRVYGVNVPDTAAPR